MEYAAPKQIFPIAQSPQGASYLGLVTANDQPALLSWMWVMVHSTKDSWPATNQILCNTNIAGVVLSLLHKLP